MIIYPEDANSADLFNIVFISPLAEIIIHFPHWNESCLKAAAWSLATSCHILGAQLICD
jgi:hypothetical protein